jgi:hypothetical protein
MAALLFNSSNLPQVSTTADFSVGSKQLLHTPCNQRNEPDVRITAVDNSTGIDYVNSADDYTMLAQNSGAQHHKPGDTRSLRAPTGRPVLVRSLT